MTMYLKLSALCMVALLAGCAASAQGRPAYVDVNALLPQHPLYGTLAQYDRQIAALEGTLRTGFSNEDAVVDNASRAVRSDAPAVAMKYDAVANRTGDLKEPQAPRAAPGSTEIAQHINQVYQQQHVQLQGAAQRDMDAYRAALTSQEQQAYDAFVASVNDRTTQAVQLRSQELREREANLSLDLAERDAGARTKLSAKLQTLYLRPDVRRSLIAQMQALQSREDAAVASAEKADAATLAAYTAQMRTRGESDLAQMRSDLTTRASANLAARERVLASQRASSAGSIDLPQAPKSAGAPVNMNAAYKQLTSASLPSDSAFSNASNDLTSRWASLKTANDDDTAHTRSQIDWLRHDREAVRKRMVSQILYEASRIAKERGYSDVVAGRAPAGALDLTSAVSSDLKSLSP